MEERTIALARTNAALRLENQSRRQTEKQLQETVSQLNATLESTADGILVVASNGKITSYNKKFLDMWDLHPNSTDDLRDESLLSSAAHQLVDPDEFLSKVEELYSNPTATSFDVLPLKGGRILERYSRPQCIGDRVVGRVWSFRDVTQSKNLEEELRQSHKMEAVGRLAGGVAHDFNNLLMLISGYVAQLLDDTALSERDRNSCEQILATTNRAASLTRQLLAFSRRHKVTPSAVDLNVILMDMEKMLRRLISEHIRVDISLCDTPLPVYVDVGQVEQVIMNLAINAQDAMPEGGVLSIRTARESIEPGDLYGDSSSASSTKSFAVLEVRDTGGGMTADVQAHIFEPFFTTKDIGKGTGLGLSTAYAIVQGAGGNIKLQTEPNNGTTFRVYLPKINTALGTSAAGVEPLPPECGNETILLAEDEEGIRAMTRVYLEGLKYCVLEAANGPEAISISLEYKGVIDLVVTDILMPGMRGDAAVNKIREQRPAIKVIYISGFADENLLGHPAEIVDKPFSFPELGRRVRSVLNSKPGDGRTALPSAAD